VNFSVHKDVKSRKIT